MNVKLRVWRQKNNDTEGGFENYEAKDLNPNMSFLEMPVSYTHLRAHET